MATGELVLLTGGNGHVGFRTLRESLERGYKVRAALRSEAKAEAVRTNAALSHIDNLDSKLSFVTVPDFLVPGAFDEAVKGVKYIIHVASPITVGTNAESPSDEDLDDIFIKPAVRGTLGVFESAQKVGGIKRIVVTSSAVTNVTLAALTGQGDLDMVVTSESQGARLSPPYPMPIVAYVASKLEALIQAQEWVAKEKPEFDVIHIHPTFVLGRDDMTSSTSAFKDGTNALLLGPVLGKKETDPRAASMVHVDDVARAHVLSLDEKVAGNQGFLLNAPNDEAAVWDDAKKYVEKHFSEAAKNGLVPNDGEVPSYQLKADVQKTIDAFGSLKTYEDMTVSVVGHYLELLEKEKKN